MAEEQKTVIGLAFGNSSSAIGVERVSDDGEEIVLENGVTNIE